MMWNVGRRFWSRPMLRWVVGAKLDIDIHPKPKPWQTPARALFWWPITPVSSTSMRRSAPVPGPSSS